MYYQNYEDYIRSILGYPVMTSNDKYQNNIQNTYHYDYVSKTPTYNKDILNLYPEIYKIINPMICKICEANTKPITEELLNQMTDEIYLNFESDNLSNEANEISNREKAQRKNNKNFQTNTSVVHKEINKELNRDNKSDKEIESRQSKVFGNPILRDLIKILILNQLLYGNSRPRPNYYKDNQWSKVRPQLYTENRYYSEYLH